MTRLYYSPRFAEHRTTPGHPERPDRTAKAHAALKAAGLLDRLEIGAFEAVDVDAIVRVHDRAVIDRAKAACEAGGGQLDADTPVSAASFEIARLAAGAAVAAVDDVLAGKTKNAFCLARPPGHHATPKRSMGFCLFNQIAIAARHATAKGQLSRVMIVDWDVHHGNGTQDIFYEDDCVLFLSAHRYPFYPGTGARGETGKGKGLGYTVNLPVAYGTAPAEYRKQFGAALDKAATKAKPELILISAGFDAHRDDPIGDLGLGVEDFVELTKLVLATADAHCGGKVVSLLEGGYNLEAMSEAVAAHVKELCEG